MVTVFADSITPRLTYTLSFIFQQYYQVEYTIAESHKQFTQATGIKINYASNNSVVADLHIIPHGLLFENEIKEQAESIEWRGNTPMLFVNSAESGSYSFDIFAAIFYLVSRYEEYLPYSADMHGRYQAKDSIACREKFLHRPLVNEWLESFGEQLSKKNPAFRPVTQRFKFQPTFDVDVAYEWQFDFLKNTVHALSLMTRRQITTSEVLKIAFTSHPDSFDIFSQLEDWHHQYEINPIFFFLVAKTRAGYDENNAPTNPKFQTLLKNLNEKHDIGLHPSYFSEMEEKLAAEKFFLESILNKQVSKSRQHYLRLQFPAMYRKLIASGITDDYSMGYGTVNGFRASFARAYFWFDLERNRETTLRLHPFAFMDSNAIFHEKLTPGSALQELLQLYYTTRKIGGTFITVMHNHFMGKRDSAWQEVYKNFLLEIADN